MMRFSSKILLFGEYGIVLGGSAVAIPYPQFSGGFTTDTTPQSVSSNQQLAYFHRWLKLNHDDLPFLDVDRFGDDIAKGLWFESTIPNGYGLGSSGALVAAVYKEYAINETEQLSKLKSRLSAIEGYFHGASSGIDPLVAYTQKPVWVGDPFTVELLDNWSIDKLGYTLYLVDTKTESKTIQLVDWFKSRMVQSTEFNERTHEDFLKPNKLLTDQLKTGEALAYDQLLKVSRYELEYLSPMVPDWFRKHYFAGIDSGDFLLKLCGSGGGGYMLCFATNTKKTEEYFVDNGCFFLRLNF
jgi:mevalonate kinase